MNDTTRDSRAARAVPPWVVRLLAVIGALALVAMTAAAFVAYLRPEAVMDFANRFYLCY